MTERQVNQEARKLVKTSIELHKKKLLGKTDLLSFLRPIAKRVALCFGTAPIGDFTKVTFNIIFLPP